MAALAAALRLPPTAPVQAALAGALAFGLTCLAAAAAWNVTAARNSAEMARFGETLARQTAALAAYPVLRQDGIRLGEISNRMAAFDEVRSVTVYSIDNRLLAAAGDIRGGSGDTWVQPVTIEDTVAGHVRVVLEPSRFHLPLAAALGATWYIWLATFALAALGCYRLAMPARRLRAPRPQRSFILVVNLFNRSSLIPSTRTRVIRDGLEIAERVARLYQGRAFEHAGAGILLAFDDSGEPDRTFEAVCGAMLAQKLFEGMHGGRGGLDGPSFRYGLALGDWYGDPAELADAPETRDAILLSALAPTGMLAIGNSAYLTVERPERLDLAPLDSLATKTLSSPSITPCRIVRGAVGTYRTLLDEQVQTAGAS